MKKYLNSVEKLIPVLIVVYMIGMGTIGPPFAKLGIPLSAGNAEGGPKIFVTEIFLFFLFAVAAANAILRPREQWKKIKPTELLVLIVVFLAIAFLRIALEIKLAPMLVVRSSAFAWYLIFPLLLLFNSVSSAEIDRAIRAGIYILFAVFCLAVILSFLADDLFFLKRSWAPEYGMAFILFTGLIYERLYTWIVPFGFLGTAIGFSLAAKVQRTSMITLAVSALIIACSLKKMSIPKKRLARIVFLALMVPAGMLLLSSRPLLGDSFLKFAFRIDFAPLRKAETGAFGIENFRESMWRDAVDLIRSNPVAGIGFREQVVKRVYMGNGIYAPNNGGFEAKNTPPISGPHNSYLNAAARLGIPTALLLLAIHGLALLVLYRWEYWPTFFCLLGQMIYACFNVGLEGPVRSFGLLICLSVALKVAQEKAPRNAVSI